MCAMRAAAAAHSIERRQGMSRAPCPQHYMSRNCWCTPVIPALGWWRTEAQASPWLFSELETSLGYMKACLKTKAKPKSKPMKCPKERHTALRPQGRQLLEVGEAPWRGLGECVVAQR